MAGFGRLTAPVGGDWRLLDTSVAAVLSVAALADLIAAPQPVGPLPALAVLSLAASAAWSRRWPVAVAAVAATGLGVLALSDFHAGNGLVVEVAVVWDFFFVGYANRAGRLSSRVAVVVYWLMASLVTGYLPKGTAGLGAGGALANMVFWALSGVLPFTVGRVLAARRAFNRGLKDATEQLQAEQAMRARLAAATERAKMARELHDVVAHCVSVMVVQSSGARRMARYDLDQTRRALRVVEDAGREALVELRRIVGVLRRDEPDDVLTPGLDQLESLMERVRLAGLPVEFSIEGPPYALPAGLQLAVYRVAQEALTNAIKHAGRATAHVSLRFGAEEVVLEVRDTGRGNVARSDHRSGHGLIGMRERVNVYGGDLFAGKGQDGGFVVRAALPVAGTDPRSPLTRPQRREPTTIGAVTPPMPHRWLDPVLALVCLLVMAAVTLTTVGPASTRLRDVSLLSVMAAGCWWRRRRPLLFVVMALAPVIALSSQMAPRNSEVTALYMVMAAYSVAAWGSRREAWLGLGLLICASALDQVFLHHVTVANYAGPMFTIAVAWAGGRAMAHRRLDSVRLERAARQLDIERDTRAELAVAGERSRIARELHAIVAQSVSAMVMQAEVAQGQIDRDLAGAEEAMGRIVVTGRQALAEMRRLLGVLRHDQQGEELVPQPCIDEIYALIQRTRDRGVPVEFTVTGEPGAIAAGVELGIYRIVEDTCNGVADNANGAVAAELRFGEDFVELRLTLTGTDLGEWPGSSIRQRIAFCGGVLSTSCPDGRDGGYLEARLPLASLGSLP
ncbi:MAG TPA: histidine kinase [Acidimicrobiales bacterium]|nr:histidine kinase [Acidimicrobiales bacterium]